MILSIFDFFTFKKKFWKFQNLCTFYVFRKMNLRITLILLWDGCYWFTEYGRGWGRAWGCWEGVGGW